MTLGKGIFKKFFNVANMAKTDVSSLLCFHLQLYTPVVSSKLKRFL